MGRKMSASSALIFTCNFMNNNLTLIPFLTHRDRLLRKERDVSGSADVGTLLLFAPLSWNEERGWGEVRLFENGVENQDIWFPSPTDNEIPN